VRRVREFLWLAVIVLCGCGGGGGGGAATVPAPVATPTPATSIPLTIGADGYTPLIAVSVGGVGVQSTVLDTGSAGLRVQQSALAGASYTDTGQSISASFGGGFTFTGTVGEADVVVGGIDIGKQVPFQIIKQVTCVAGISCNLNAVPSALFGVRPRIATDGVLYSLLSELPGNLNSGFIVSLTGNPHLQVGATAANSVGFTTYSVPTATLADGSPTWNQSIEGGLLPWCYTAVIGSYTLSPACPVGGVLTDSGAGPVGIFVEAVPPANVTGNQLSQLASGAQVTATVGNITWTLPSTGTCVGYNQVYVYFSVDTPAPTNVGNTNGITPFYGNDVLFDLKGGNFGLRPVSTGIPSFC
jgi:hypothetical protein